MIKQYLLSINDEIEDNFNSTIESIKIKTTEEVLSSNLQSNNLAIKNIVEIALNNFIDELVTILDYYADGVFHSGKVMARKKMKLEILKENGKKYSLTHANRIFIDRFKFSKLNHLGEQLKSSSIKYIVHKITKKIQNQDDENTEAFIYKKQYLDGEESKEILSIIIDTVSSIYSDIIEVSTEEVILLFKCGQLEEYKDLGIKHVRINSSNDDDSSCEVCKTRSLQIFDIDSLLKNSFANKDYIHPFCKMSIEPIIEHTHGINDVNTLFNLSENFNSNYNDDFMLNKDIKKTEKHIAYNDINFYDVPIDGEEALNKIMKRIKMYAPEFLKPLEFYFVNDIVETKDWLNKIKEEYLSQYNELRADTNTHQDQDSLRGQIISFRILDKVLVSNFSLHLMPIEDTIVREIIRGNEIKDLDWWKSYFEEKRSTVKTGDRLKIYQSPFINYLAQNSLEDFILESIVAYVTNPNLLKIVDNKTYEKIKSDIFNNIKF